MANDKSLVIAVIGIVALALTFGAIFSGNIAGSAGGSDTSNTICRDSDGGQKPYLAGTATVYNSNTKTVLRTYKDICKDTTSVTEYVCNAEGTNYGYTTVPCPAGCSNGACNCYDTDAMNTATKGTVISKSGTFTDICANGGTDTLVVSEYGCTNNDAAKYDQACAYPMYCKDGACIQPVCNNGLLERGEKCDGANLAGQSCKILGYARGTLKCTSDCVFDARACVIIPTTCGNGRLEAGEQCEGNVSKACTAISSSFTGGTARCSGCSYDTSLCTGPKGGYCGDAVVTVGEQCDSSVMSNCTAFGFGSGTLACNPLTCHYDTGRCILLPPKICGDGVIQSPNDAGLNEQCDGTNLNGRSCTSFNYTGGTLRCSSSCTYDYSSCLSLMQSCTDSDNGIDYYKIGAIRNAEGKTATDGCGLRDSTLCGDGTSPIFDPVCTASALVEYYCGGNSVALSIEVNDIFVLATTDCKYMGYNPTTKIATIFFSSTLSNSNYNVGDDGTFTVAYGGKNYKFLVLNQKLTNSKIKIDTPVIMYENIKCASGTCSAGVCTPACKDTDGGINYYKAGTVTNVEGVSEADSCGVAGFNPTNLCGGPMGDPNFNTCAASALVEHYCGGNTPVTAIKVGELFHIGKGDCIYSSYEGGIVSAMCGMSSQNAPVDADGKFTLYSAFDNLPFKFSLVNKDLSNSDIISAIPILMYENIKCDSGTCTNGACTPQPCADTDGGLNYYTAGTATSTDGKTATDQCGLAYGNLCGDGSSPIFDPICSASALIENYCGGNSETSTIKLRQVFPLGTSDSIYYGYDPATKKASVFVFMSINQYDVGTDGSFTVIDINGKSYKFYVINTEIKDSDIRSEKPLVLYDNTICDSGKCSNGVCVR